MHKPMYKDELVWSPKFKGPKKVLYFVIQPKTGKGDSLYLLSLHNAAVVVEGGISYPLEDVRVLLPHEEFLLEEVKRGVTIPQMKQRYPNFGPWRISEACTNLIKFGLVTLVGRRYKGVLRYTGK